MAEFRMPSLGADMDEGVLLEWLVQPGSTVHKGDIVAVVDTAKAAVEVETFASGVIDRILVPAGQRVPVGTLLATITETAQPATPAPQGIPLAPAAAPPAVAAAGAASPVTSPLVRHLAAVRHVDLLGLHGTGLGGRITHADVERAAAATPAAPPAARPDAAPPAAPPGAAQPPVVPPPDVARPGTAAAQPARLRVSPLARRLAGELGVDLTRVRGTGPGGVIDADDVRRAAAPAPPAREPATPSEPPAELPVGTPADRSAAMRTVIANLMARSKREIPHYYLSETVDLGPAMEWLHEVNRRIPVSQRLVPASLLLKAAAVALRTVPQLNGFWTDDRFVPGAGIHLGVAVSLRGGGLVAPAIHDAADLDLATLMQRVRDLVIRARAGRLRRAELSDPTITVSNMGEQGAESIFGVIYPPQVALVGFGKIVDRPWAVDGLIGVRPVVTVSLAADHRATDGATGARYLQALARLLHTPEEL